MADLDLDKMLRDAEAATQEEWLEGGPYPDHSVVIEVCAAAGFPVPEPAVHEAIAIELTAENARHIANCDPPTIIALIERLKEVEGALSDRLEIRRRLPKPCGFSPRSGRIRWTPKN